MLVGLFIALLALIFIGVPVVVAIGVVALGGIFALPGLAPVEFPRRMFAAVDSFSLLALPYFILAGELMVRGGMSRRLVEFAETLVGHLRGGLGHATVLANMIFANVTGSSVASTSAIGSLMAPEMKARGYKGGFIASLAACSGVIGAIIPPSMVMVVYGAMAGVSIGGLFLGGFLPGLLITGLLMLVVKLHGYHPDFPEIRATTGAFSLAKVAETLPRVWVAVLAPVIILGGIMTGVFTATEAGVVACFYSLIISMFVYRSVTVRDLPRILLTSAVTTTVVLGIIAVAGALGWLLTYLNFTEIVGGWLLGVSSKGWVVLLTLIALMLVLTMFIESLAVLIILTPLIVKIGATFALDPIYLGILVVIATQIGATTPPVAVCLFVGTSIAGCRYDETIRSCWPFIAALLAALLAVFLWPPLSTFIPNTFLK
ncbi:MAG: TRAP transporter large permease [Opitutaceae bacterium]|nr:TRAP transporter large permease [Opitutaceae bacterium]